MSSTFRSQCCPKMVNNWIRQKLCYNIDSRVKGYTECLEFSSVLVQFLFQKKSITTIRSPSSLDHKLFWYTHTYTWTNHMTLICLCVRVKNTIIMLQSICCYTITIIAVRFGGLILVWLPSVINPQNCTRQGVLL